MESDHVLINNVNVQSDNITHDGIDVVDGQDVTVEECAVRSGDDAMCLKSGVRRGIDTMVVRNSIFGGSGTSGGSNGIKFGTATYGAFTNITIQDSYVKDVQYAAMAVESRQGSDVDSVAFKRIELRQHRRGVLRLPGAAVDDRTRRRRAQARQHQQRVVHRHRRLDRRRGPTLRTRAR